MARHYRPKLYLNEHMQEKFQTIRGKTFEVTRFDVRGKPYRVNVRVPDSIHEFARQAFDHYADEIYYQVEER